MNKNRLEAFSDGVLAILITIMVLELKVPHSTELKDLLALWPVLLSYLLSFIYLAIYWNNHHHLFQAVDQVNGSVLWANMHLLFWLSLLPFVTAWSGENQFADLPVALYGAVLFFSAIAYSILTKVLLLAHGPNSTIAKAIGEDLKGKISIGSYALAVVTSFYSSELAVLLYCLIAIMWIVPDKRIERTL